jgi:hypothetical protein
MSDVRLPDAILLPVAAPRVTQPIGAHDIAEVARAMVDKAKTGDPRAAEVARRIWARQPVRLDLPPIDDLAGIARAQLEVIRLVAAGQIAPHVGKSVSTMLDHRRQAIEALELDQDLRDIHEANRKKFRESRGRP